MAADLHPEARAEIRLSALWYDEQRPGLGDEFVSEVMAALERVEENPDVAPAERRLWLASPSVPRRRAPNVQRHAPA